MIEVRVPGTFVGVYHVDVFDLETNSPIRETIGIVVPERSPYPGSTSEVIPAALYIRHFPYTLPFDSKVTLVCDGIGHIQQFAHGYPGAGLDLTLKSIQDEKGNTWINNSTPPRFYYEHLATS